MIKLKLVKIEKNDDVDNDGSEWENQGGSVFLTVNNKEVEVIIHPCGELDFEGPSMSDEEFDAVTEFIANNKKVQKAFPSEEFC